MSTILFTMTTMTGCADAAMAASSRWQTDAGQSETKFGQMQSDADTAAMLKGISTAQSISIIPLARLASNPNLKLEALFGAGLERPKGNRIAPGLADQIRQLSTRSLTGLPIPPPFPFHLDTIVRFDAGDETVVLTACRICRYGYFYVRTAGGVVASRRTSLDELDSALDAASPDYQQAPHN